MDVNNDIIVTFQEKNVSIHNGGDSAVVRALDEKLRDLEEELKVSRQFHRNLLNRLSTEESKDSVTSDMWFKVNLISVNVIVTLMLCVN